MKVLGTIRQVCDSRTFFSNGNPIVVYPIIFDAGSDEFVGDMFASEETLKRRGVKNGAIGNMEIEFKVREAKRSTGDSYPVQSVKFRDFRLANAGIFNDNAPAASGGDANVSKEEPKVENPKQDAPAEGTIGDDENLTF